MSDLCGCGEASVKSQMKQIKQWRYLWRGEVGRQREDVEGGGVEWR